MQGAASFTCMKEESANFRCDTRDMNMDDSKY